MIGEYLKSLEKEYGYTGNWQPNCPIQVGNWADVELGFLPWLKEFLGISYKCLQINQDLHSVMAGVLDGIDVKKEKRAPFSLCYGASWSMSASCDAVNIKSEKKGGFFAIFQGIKEINAEPKSFRDKLETLDKTSVAVVSGLTYVKKGILIIFTQEASSLTLSGKSSSFAGLLDDPGAIDMNFNVSYENEGAAVYRAEPDKPLVPFFKIYIAEKDKQSGFCGYSARPGRNYDIMPFSYGEFFNLYQGFGVQGGKG